MSDIQPASFADLKKAWDFYKAAQANATCQPPNYRTYRLEFLRGIDQIKTQAKTDALRDAAESHDLISHMYKYFAHPHLHAPPTVRAASSYLHDRADRLEGDDE